eukprot:TRINITY_DN283_c1_g1_i1.p1 TRINITY_DN283_c1_g1~~TRINITY_DN283_c1_g1_i1.p1  ORF type:complete len:2298 (-),score=513.50 TRINITY_DN283_c1_g1_i1:535-7245(-)
MAPGMMPYYPYQVPFAQPRTQLGEAKPSAGVQGGKDAKSEFEITQAAAAAAAAAAASSAFDGILGKDQKEMLEKARGASHTHGKGSGAVPVTTQGSGDTSKGVAATSQPHPTAPSGALSTTHGAIPGAMPYNPMMPQGMMMMPQHMAMPPSMMMPPGGMPPGVPGGAMPFRPMGAAPWGYPQMPGFTPGVPGMPPGAAPSGLPPTPAAATSAAVTATVPAVTATLGEEDDFGDFEVAGGTSQKGATEPKASDVAAAQPQTKPAQPAAPKARDFSAPLSLSFFGEEEAEPVPDKAPPPEILPQTLPTPSPAPSGGVSPRAPPGNLQQTGANAGVPPQQSFQPAFSQPFPATNLSMSSAPQPPIATSQVTAADASFDDDDFGDFEGLRPTPPPPNPTVPSTAGAHPGAPPVQASSASNPNLWGVWDTTVGITSSSAPNPPAVVHPTMPTAGAASLPPATRGGASQPPSVQHPASHLAGTPSGVSSYPAMPSTQSVLYREMHDTMTIDVQEMFAPGSLVPPRPSTFPPTSFPNLISSQNSSLNPTVNPTPFTNPATSPRGVASATPPPAQAFPLQPLQSQAQDSLFASMPVASAMIPSAIETATPGTVISAGAEDDDWGDFADAPAEFTTPSEPAVMSPAGSSAPTNPALPPGQPAPTSDVPLAAVPAAGAPPSVTEPPVPQGTSASLPTSISQRGAGPIDLSFFGEEEVEDTDITFKPQEARVQGDLAKPQAVGVSLESATGGSRAEGEAKAVPVLVAGLDSTKDEAAELVDTGKEATNTGGLEAKAEGTTEVEEDEFGDFEGSSWTSSTIVPPSEALSRAVDVSATVGDLAKGSLGEHTLAKSGGEGFQGVEEGGKAVGSQDLFSGGVVDRTVKDGGAVNGNVTNDLSFGWDALVAPGGGSSGSGNPILPSVGTQTPSGFGDFDSLMTMGSSQPTMGADPFLSAENLPSGIFQTVVVGTMGGVDEDDDFGEFASSTTDAPPSAPPDVPPGAASLVTSTSEQVPLGSAPLDGGSAQPVLPSGEVVSGEGGFFTTSPVGKVSTKEGESALDVQLSSDVPGQLAHVQHEGSDAKLKTEAPSLVSQGLESTENVPDTEGSTHAGEPAPLTSESTDPAMSIPASLGALNPTGPVSKSARPIPLSLFGEEEEEPESSLPSFSYSASFGPSASKPSPGGTGKADLSDFIKSLYDTNGKSGGKEASPKFTEKKTEPSPESRISGFSSLVQQGEQKTAPIQPSGDDVSDQLGLSLGVTGSEPPAQFLMRPEGDHGLEGLDQGFFQANGESSTNTEAGAGVSSEAPVSSSPSSRVQGRPFPGFLSGIASRVEAAMQRSTSGRSQGSPKGGTDQSSDKVQDSGSEAAVGATAAPVLSPTVKQRDATSPGTGTNFFTRFFKSMDAPGKGSGGSGSKGSGAGEPSVGGAFSGLTRKPTPKQKRGSAWGSGSGVGEEAEDIEETPWVGQKLGDGRVALRLAKNAAKALVPPMRVKIQPDNEDATGGEKALSEGKEVKAEASNDIAEGAKEAESEEAAEKDLGLQEAARCLVEEGRVREAYLCRAHLSAQALLPQLKERYVAALEEARLEAAAAIRVEIQAAEAALGAPNQVQQWLTRRAPPLATKPTSLPVPMEASPNSLDANTPILMETDALSPPLEVDTTALSVLPASSTAAESAATTADDAAVTAASPDDAAATATTADAAVSTTADVIDAFFTLDAATPTAAAIGDSKVDAADSMGAFLSSSLDEIPTPSADVSIEGGQSEGGGGGGGDDGTSATVSSFENQVNVSVPMVEVGKGAVLSELGEVAEVTHDKRGGEGGQGSEEQAQSQGDLLSLRSLGETQRTVEASAVAKELAGHEEEAVGEVELEVGFESKRSVETELAFETGVKKEKVDGAEGTISDKENVTNSTAGDLMFGEERTEENKGEEADETATGALVEPEYVGGASQGEGGAPPQVEPEGLPDVPAPAAAVAVEEAAPKKVLPLLDRSADRNLSVDEMAEYLGRAEGDLRAVAFDAEFRGVDIVALARKDLQAAVELHCRALYCFRILRCASASSQQAYVEAWAGLATVCASILEQASEVWEKAVEADIEPALMASSKGKVYLAGVCQIHCVSLVLAAAAQLYSPWLRTAGEVGQQLWDQLLRASSAWEASGLEAVVTGVLPGLADRLAWAESESAMDCAEVAACQVSECVLADPLPLLLCGISLLPVLVFDSVAAVDWEGRHYLLPLVNLWANQVSKNSPNLPLFRLS